jgi:hypothetical protein
LRLREGGRYGDIFGRTFERAEDGSIYVDDSGKPVAKSGALEYLGNPAPDFLMSWSNTFTYKNFVASFLIDGRFGGKVMSMTQSMMDEYGVSEATADARKNGGVSIDATRISDDAKVTEKIDAEQYYTGVGGRAGITEAYMYDATNIRLRELSIGYKLPLQGKYVKDLRLSLVGRNLFFISKDAPYDPELSMSTGNGVQGVDVFSIPATRSIGLNIKWSF